MSRGPRSDERPSGWWRRLCQQPWLVGARGPLDFTVSLGILMALSGPKWRNWQTRMIQGHVPARVWGFKSPLRHHATPERSPNFAETDLATRARGEGGGFDDLERVDAVGGAHEIGGVPGARRQEGRELGAQRLVADGGHALDRAFNGIPGRATFAVLARMERDGAGAVVRHQRAALADDDALAMRSRHEVV